jgi:hypothetical protein
MKDIIAQIDDVARERASRYVQQFIDNPFPPPREWGSGLVFVGGYSLTMTDKKIQYLRDTIPLPNSHVTPTQASRDYVSVKFPEPLRSRKSQWAWWEAFHRSQPMATKRGRYNRMVYLDLKSAYWSIIKLVGWDAEYFEKWIVRGTDMKDFPFSDNRIARNSLVTNFLPKSKTIAYLDGSLVAIPTGKRTINYGLWCLVMDVLHGIAWDMWHKFDAVYVNTDGYIIPEHHEENAIEYIRQRWGLDIGQKGRGIAQVWGVGVYDIGTHRAKVMAKSAQDLFAINDTGNKNREALSQYLQMFRRLTV